MAEVVGANDRVRVTKSGEYDRSLVSTSEVSLIPRSFTEDGYESLYLLNRVKRMGDLILSILFLPYLMLLFPCIALAIKMSSDGNILFKQKRIGRDGEVFICYKFRTMHEKRLLPFYASTNVTGKKDERVFAVGVFLRKLNLDELPQIINVIKGDMSLVGPRPYMKIEDKHWADVFDQQGYNIRRHVRPGITGLAQVNGYCGRTLNEKHMERRLMYDLLYVKSYNMKNDFLILWRTGLKMLRLETGG